MNYLLDTNACIAIINGKPPAVRSRFEREMTAGGDMFVPAVVAFELWYGVARSSWPEKNRDRVRTFFSGPVTTLAFDDEDAQIAGALRATLEAAGTPIGSYDLLIAGQALRQKLTLVTANASEFARIKGLIWEDWGKSL